MRSPVSESNNTMNKILVNNSDLKLFKHEIVTVKIPAGSTLTQFYLPDMRNLRNTKLLAIEAWKKEAVPTTPDGVDTLDNTQLSKTFLTLENYSGKQFLKDCPAKAFDFSAHQTAGGDLNYETFKKTFNQQRVNYPKSYITWRGGVPVADVSFMVSVYYADVDSEKEGTFDNRS